MHLLLIRIRNSLKYRAKAKIWEFYKKFNIKITINSTSQGKYIYRVQNDDPIHKWLYVEGNHELELVNNSLAFLTQHYNINKNTVLDIGANNGVISIGMILNKEFKNALAIEPEPDNFERMKKNIELNKVSKQIETFNIALSNKKDTLTFELSQENFGDHRIRTNTIKTKDDLYNEADRKTISVPCDTLNSFIKDKGAISLIWMDVQGFEIYILEGGKEFFDSLHYVLPVVSEYWPYGMKRTGITRKKMKETVSNIFTHYYLFRYGRFIKYDIKNIGILWDELDYKNLVETVIYVNENKLNNL